MGMIRRYNICSDMHIGGDNTAYVETALTRYEQDYRDGALTICMGDWQQGSGSAGAYNETIGGFMNRLKAINADMVTGNHDCGQTYALDGAEWLSRSGRSLYYEAERDGIVFLFCSGEKWGAASNAANQIPIYSDAARAWLLGRLEANKEKPVILFTHYPYTYPNPFSALPSSHEYYFGFRSGYKTNPDSGQTYNYFFASSDKDFYNAIAAYKNILWLTGHTHTPWAKEDEYPNIKAYTISGGPSMINLPSLGWAGEDAVMTVYGDKVEVQARGINDGEITNLGYSYTWDFEKITKGTSGGGDEPDEPDDPDDPTPPSGGVLSVHIRLTRGGTITRYEELPTWVRERLERVPERPEDKEKLWYMKDGVRHEVTWSQLEAEYEYNLDGGVLTIVRAPCRVEGGVLYIE